MKNLLQQLREDHGHFRTQSLTNPDKTRDIPYRHLILPPEDTDIPDIGKLPALYRECSAIIFFYLEKSQESARYLARPQDWPDLYRDCHMWFDGMADDEWEDIVPAPLLARDGYTYTLNALVIGETPHTGNYILIDKTHGTLYEFDHDGYTFTAIAPDILQYTALTLNPDPARLADYASHIRFIENDHWDDQWIITALHHADGRHINFEDHA